MITAAAAAEPPVTPGSWTLVHIPDTQNYVSSAAGAAIFATDTRWIADRALARNIRFAVQVGDLVNNNDPVQWSRARSGFDVLSGLVPYALCSGNHDCGPDGNGHSRDTLFTTASYFGVDSPYAAQPTLRGFFQHPADPPGNTQNSWHSFTVGGIEYLVLTCEWGPRDAVVSWLAERIQAHPFHRVIIVVHAYLASATLRFDWTQSQDGINPHAYGISTDSDGVNDGGEIWEKVGRKFENVCLICCGHSTRALMTSRGDKGNNVHQMLFNTQDLPNGGDGWLRLLEFFPDDRTVRARTFSPYLDVSDLSAGADFTIRISPVSSLDSDSDGLPDYFEARHQFDPLDPSDAASDADADGMSNLDEFHAATDTRDPRSRLSVISFSVEPATGGELRWSSVPGMTYQIESNPSLARESWALVSAVTAAEWETALSIPPLPGSRSYFRVVPVRD